MGQVAMELINVRKTIGKKEIIKGLSFKINEGEVFGLIGPNGSGKTTTIRMMVGLMKLTEGDVRIFGKSIQTNFKEAVEKVGAIVENPEMYPFLTGWQNLKHYARMMPGITKERIEEVIGLVGLEKAIHHKVSKYSLGMRQRLGIAQALLHKPKVLILDEPTNGLDPAGMREIREYIRHLATEEKVSIIISSHLLSEIEQMCDHIGIIQNGKLIAVQSIDEINESETTTERDVTIEVVEIDEATSLLQREFKIQSVKKNGTISFQAEKEIIPMIIKSFVNHDLTIFRVETERLSLEDKFFDMIGENIIE